MRTVACPDSCATDKAKLAAIDVTPQPPFDRNQRKGKVLSGAGPHKANSLLDVRFGGVEHHAGIRAGADAADQVEDIVRIAVDVENHDVVNLADGPGNFVQIGRKR